MSQFIKLQIIGGLLISFIFGMGLYSDWTNRKMDSEGLENRMEILQQDLTNQSLTKGQSNSIVEAIRRESQAQSYSYYMNSLLRNLMTTMLAIGLFSITISALKNKNDN